MSSSLSGSINELVGLSIDVSESMFRVVTTPEKTSTKIHFALRAAYDLALAIKGSSLPDAYSFSIVLFGGDKREYLSPITSDKPYTTHSDDEFDELIEKLRELSEETDTTDDDEAMEIRKNLFGSFGSFTDYKIALEKPYEATEKYVEENHTIYDDLFSTRIVYTDGCHVSMSNTLNDVKQMIDLIESGSIAGQRCPGSVGFLIVADEKRLVPCVRPLCNIVNELGMVALERLNNIASVHPEVRDSLLCERFVGPKKVFLFKDRSQTVKLMKSVIRVVSKSYNAQLSRSF